MDDISFSDMLFLNAKKKKTQANDASEYWTYNSCQLALKLDKTNSSNQFVVVYWEMLPK